eukprot:1159580-Pelagomonas_calceolata.AAC.4
MDALTAAFFVLSLNTISAMQDTYTPLLPVHAFSTFVPNGHAEQTCIAFLLDKAKLGGSYSSSRSRI